MKSRECFIDFLKKYNVSETSPAQLTSLSGDKAVKNDKWISDNTFKVDDTLKKNEKIIIGLHIFHKFLFA